MEHRLFDDWPDLYKHGGFPYVFWIRVCLFVQHVWNYMVICIVILETKL